MMSIVDLTSKGGIVMWPLYLAALISLYIIIERSVAFYKFRKRERMFLADLEVNGLTAEDMFSGEFVPAWVFSKKMDAEQTLADLSMELELDLGRFRTGLTIIYKAAPLLGLLGTVIGMIKVFRQMSSSGLEQTQFFAGGISEALLTTATGLVISIPALVFTFYQAALLNRKIVEYESIYLRNTGNK